MFPEPRCTRIDELTAKSLSRKTLGELMVLFCKPVCFLLSWFSKKCLQSDCALIGVCYVTREHIKYTSAPHFTRIFENLLENMSENMHLCDNTCRQFLAFFTFECSSKSFASACVFLFSFMLGIIFGRSDKSCLYSCFLSASFVTSVGLTNMICRVLSSHVF